MKCDALFCASLKCWVAGIYFLINFPGNVTVMASLPFINSSSVTLAWSPSIDPDVTGYKIYYGTASHKYMDAVMAGNLTTMAISGFQPGITYYFAVTAYDASGVESDFSNEASYTIPIIPSIATTLISPIYSGSQFSFSVAGISGLPYLVEASTNLTEWFAVQTNTAPFTYTEANMGQFGSKFFRAVPLL